MGHEKKLIAHALQELGRASDRLCKGTAPNTPMPRPKVFRFGRFAWPNVSAPDTRWWGICDTASIETLSLSSYNSDLASEKIMIDCGRQPRKILRALRRIQAATAWCEARTEGRKRQAEEILRQQAAAVEALDAEAALLALK